ncbi:MAG: phosphatidylserine decarboxylase family protein [Synergistaceae bacterium]|nr:phosphatidylserine decarboxylase family protein [Synergistaceae bacterium]
MKFAQGSRPAILGSVLITGITMLIHPLPAMLMCCITGLIIWFYRDPERDVPRGAGLFVSPADGKVVEITPATREFAGESLKIGIFMNAFSVHVNRAPCEGVIEYMDYVPGKKIAAFSSKASEINERFYVGLRTQHGAVLLVQIAGLLARRIVCRRRVGDSLARGERYGMIKLGSKVDVYLPVNATVKVKIGDRVLAGKSIIAGVGE